MMSLPIWLFIILLLPWMLITLCILYSITLGIIGLLCDKYKSKKHKKESDACIACPDYMEGKDEDL